MTDQGIRVQGRPVRPPAEATTLRIRNGKLHETAGTFPDSEQQMRAFELIECRDLEHALEVAGQHPMSTATTIAVRPVWSSLGA